MRRALFFMLVLALPNTARAEDDVCLTAPVDGQKLQRAGHLLEARARFSTCASRTCPAEIVEDCARWARDVEEALPSIVLAARDGAGRDVADVRASIDGGAPQPITPRAVAVDPGTHRVVFRRAGTPDVTREVIVREGEKNRAVTVSFTGGESSSRSDGPLPLSVWIAGGVGAAAFASFALFGALGVGGRAAKNCDVGCAASDKSTVDSQLFVADVSLAIAVVAFGVATYFYLSRPAARTPAAALVW
jgi:hypothetical protein